MKIQTIVGVVVVVGALVAVGVLSPAKFHQLQCRAAQRDGTGTLKELRKRISDNLVKSQPASSFADLAWEPKTHNYDYNISIGFNGHFTVEARANDLNGDVWLIDEVGVLQNKVDGCAVAR